MDKSLPVCVYFGPELGRYGFGQGHPFGPDRLDAFWNTLKAHGLDRAVSVVQPVMAQPATIELFHDADYVSFVARASQDGAGFLDYGDTPVFPGVFEAASYVVGSSVDAADRLLDGRCRRAFVPIAGLHHARRERAAGFCVFNDCGVVIEHLRSRHGLRRIAYVDIDAHHGDGVFYSYADDPDLIFADIHEDGRFMYPGTGSASETGTGKAQGTKLNFPMPPGADDEAFMAVWPKIEHFVRKGRPEFILLQCGADSVNGDPLTHMQFSPRAHAHAAERLGIVADECCSGRLLGVGGGGYNRTNIGEAWTAVIERFIGRGSVPDPA